MSEQNITTDEIIMTGIGASFCKNVNKPIAYTTIINKDMISQTFQHEWLQNDLQHD